MFQMFLSRNHCFFTAFLVRWPVELLLTIHTQRAPPFKPLLEDRDEEYIIAGSVSNSGDLVSSGQASVSV